MLLYQILAFAIQENSIFTISSPTWNEEFELLDGSYSVSDIQDYFEYITKNMRKLLIII